MAAQPPANILSGPMLARYVYTSLPLEPTPQVTNATEAIALASHAALLSVGARLVGLGEDHRIAAESGPEKPTPLPAEWRTQGGGGNYAFRYKHGQSSMEFLLKITRMGGKAVVMGMGVGDDRTCSFDVKATDYISEGNLPLTIPAAAQSEADKKEEIEGGDNEAASSSNTTASGRFPTNPDPERKVSDLFISVGRLSDFGNLMRINIIQKLLPSLQKEGYQEERSSAAQTAADERERRSAHDPPRHDPLREDRDSPARPFPLHDPLAVPRPAPGRPLPDPIPGFDDEFEMQRPGRGMFPGGGGVGGGFGRIGERDLYPQGLGPNDPIRGGIGPGLGGFGGGGMHPTFDDPLFGGQGQGGQGGAYDPRAPPGSRYDPVGPGGPGGGHPRGAGMGGRPPNPFGGFGDGDFI